jgi:dGTPase
MNMKRLPAYHGDSREDYGLAPYAMRTADSAGREHGEREHAYRGAFQRDRDRIVHSAAFRRLSGKTQVFTGNLGDYHRTRLTHTMEVASIARTIGRTLQLNEDLIEALALLHDIGHPPFGHAGEDALNECLVDDGGFSHNAFALTLVRYLERPYPQYPGLNLTREVLESQEFRTRKQAAPDQPLLEAQVVEVADSIAYDAHDVDDAVKLGLLPIDELLALDWVAACHQQVTARFGSLQGKMLRRTLVHELIDVQVGDVLATSQQILQQQAPQSVAEVRAADGFYIRLSPELAAQKCALEALLYDRVYRHPSLVETRKRAQQMLRAMFQLYCQDRHRLPVKFQQRCERVGVDRAAAEYLAGMTDDFCLHQFARLIERPGGFDESP